MAVNTNYDYLFKIVVIGASDVGKTNLVKQYVKGEYDEKSKPTVIEFYEKLVDINKSVVKAQIWDIGGQQSSIRHFYRGAWGFVVVYSVNDRDSFEKAKQYLDDVKKSVLQNASNNNNRNQVAILLVGNKKDVKDSSRQVSPVEGRELAEKENVMFVETSALNGKEQLTSDVFEKLVSVIFKTTSFEKAYPSGSVTLDSDSISPVVAPKKSHQPGLSLVQVKDFEDHNALPMVSLKKKGSMDDMVDTNSVDSDTMTTDNAYGILFRSISHSLGKMSYQMTCGDPDTPISCGGQCLLFFPRFLLQLMLFLFHYLLLFFIILPFSFWYLALRKLKKVTQKSVDVQETSFCMTWTSLLCGRALPVLLLIFAFPIVFVYIISNLIDPNQPEVTNQIVSGSIGFLLAVLFLFEIICIIRREQAATLVGVTTFSPSEFIAPFRFSNPRNMLLLIVLLWELVQMVTWPLQEYNTSNVDVNANGLDRLTKETFPALFWTLPYSQYRVSTGLSIAVVFVIITVLTIQFMYDSRKYAQLMTQGKLEEAGDYYSHSFVGACAYAHGVLKYANFWTCASIILLCEGAYMMTLNQLLTALSCSKETGRWLADPSMVCWQGEHVGIAVGSLISLGYYLFISLSVAPMFITSGQAPNDVRYSELYLRLLTVFKSGMLIFATFYASRAQWALIVSTLLVSIILFSLTFIWTLFPNTDYLIKPCTSPFVNMFKCMIYLTSFWSAAIAYATTVAFENTTQNTKFALVLLGLLADFFTMCVCYVVYRCGTERNRRFSQVSFQI